MIIPGIKAHFEMSFYFWRWRSLCWDCDLFWGALLAKQDTLYLAISELLFLRLNKNQTTL